MMYEVMLVGGGVVAGFLIGGVTSLLWMKKTIHNAKEMCDRMTVVHDEITHGLNLAKSNYDILRMRHQKLQEDVREMQDERVKYRGLCRISP